MLHSVFATQSQTFHHHIFDPFTFYYQRDSRLVGGTVNFLMLFFLSLFFSFTLKNFTNFSVCLSFYVRALIFLFNMHIKFFLNGEVSWEIFFFFSDFFPGWILPLFADQVSCPLPSLVVVCVHNCTHTFLTFQVGDLSRSSVLLRQ